MQSSEFRTRFSFLNSAQLWVFGGTYGVCGSESSAMRNGYLLVYSRNHRNSPLARVPQV